MHTKGSKVGAKLSISPTYKYFAISELYSSKYFVSTQLELYIELYIIKN